VSTQPTQDLDPAPIDAQTVADYLRRHPDFFLSHAELLSELAVPHPSGDAVSLVERQICVLREHNQHLKHQLQTLIHNARSNETLSERIHRLTLSLLACDTPEGMFTALCHKLREDFEADGVVVCLTEDAAHLMHAAAPRQGLELRRLTAEDLRLFDDLVKDRQAVCGRLTHRQRSYLFGEHAAAVTSVALTPLAAGPEGEGHGELLGMLAIGSRDTQRFQSGMGTVFLKQLAEIVAARLAGATA